MPSVYAAAMYSDVSQNCVVGASVATYKINAPTDTQAAIKYGGFTALNGAFGWPVVAAYVLVACVLTLVGLAIGRNPDPAEDEAYLALTPRAAPAT